MQVAKEDSLTMTLKNSITELWRDKGVFFSFRISSQQATTFILSRPVVAARC
jgi:hypothetical protein